MSANIIPPPIMRTDPMNAAVRDLAERVQEQQGEKLTLMGIIKSEETQRVVGMATFLLMVLTLLLFGTILSDIRNDIRAIRTETSGNTTQVSRMQEQIRWMEKRIERIESKIEK